jgi:hypothetical protein
LVGIGGTTLWRWRAVPLARGGLAVAIATTALWAFVLLDRSPHWLPWLRVVVLIGGVVSALVLVLVGAHRLTQLPRRAIVVLTALGLVVALGAPAAYAVNTAKTSHNGAIPSAGPASANGGGFGGPGGPGRRRGFGGFRGFAGPRAIGPGGGNQGFGAQGGGLPPGVFGGGAAGGQGGTTQQQGGFQPGGTGGFGGGSVGGLLESSTANAALVTALQADASKYTWVAAVTGSNSAAGYQLASGKPVMAIGGFNGTDPAPTLAQFISDVRAGKIHYYISGGRQGFGGGGFGGFGGRGAADGGSTSVASQISAWVEAHATASTIGGTTVYDLTAVAS